MASRRHASENVFLLKCCFLLQGSPEETEEEGGEAEMG
jgi:hypothetical protein